MGRKLSATCKQCRREGEKLYLKHDKCIGAKCPMLQRGFPPGQHGPTSRTRLTPYGAQLREKQKAKNTYGMLERQFRKYYDNAKKAVGNTASFLVQMLEMRLDNTVYRLGFGKSRALARQLVSHGHIQVNGKRVDIPSYQVKAGDLVSLAEKSRKSKLFENDLPRLEKHQPPSWLNLDVPNWTGKVLSKPEGADLKQNFDPRAIVEFYSR